ncbi:MAG: precorrin-2 C(20)-methyltransferase, partial [Ruminococcus sp.]|nr:precorrin-2 C(20)-methyltransferase [Ruminococcus sp.]
LMKTGKQLAKVKQLLKNENYQVEMVENCGMKNEKIYRTIDDIPETTGYYSLMIIKEAKE